ncbi:ATP-binding protein [bacterium]|nr:ATP-binding protein [bacterium]
MIPKPLTEIGLDDLNLLKSNSVREGRTIEYKRDLPGHKDSDKKKFLADVSSFANAAGGDLIIGIKAESGIPTAIDGVSCTSIDAEMLKYEGIIRDNLEPRIQFQMSHVLLPNGNVVFIIRVAKAWNSPHRITFQSQNRFWSRHSTGKYELDVHELRTAFLLTENLSQKIVNFRVDRLSKIINNVTPISLKSSDEIPIVELPKVILHMIPLVAFNPGVNFDLTLVRQNPSLLQPMRSSGWNHRNNLDGFVTHSGNFLKNDSYVQLFRTGIVEAVVEIGDINGQDKTFPSYYEPIVLRSASQYLQVQKQIDVSLPIFIFLSFTGIKDYRIAPSLLFAADNYRYEQDQLILPEVMVGTYADELDQVMKPIFDLFWNAFGLDRSFNYDKNGKWTGGSWHST